MYLLDTNICIYLIKNQPEIVLKNLKKHSISLVKNSSVTVAELFYEVEKRMKKKTNEDTLISFLSAFELLPFTDTDGIAYGKIRASLETKGKIISPYDIQIAAQAMTRNLILVTNNDKEFQRVPGLIVENWAKK